MALRQERGQPIPCFRFTGCAGRQYGCEGEGAWRRKSGCFLFKNTIDTLKKKEFLRNPSCFTKNVHRVKAGAQAALAGPRCPRSWLRERSAAFAGGRRLPSELDLMFFKQQRVTRFPRTCKRAAHSSGITSFGAIVAISGWGRCSHRGAPSEM